MTSCAPGELDADAVGLPTRVADQVATTDGIELVRIPGESTVLLLSHHNPIFADPLVREAVGLAMDRQAIAEGVFAGAARPTVSPIYAGHWAAADVPMPARDIAAAAQLLDQAGWMPGLDGVRVRDGQPLVFPLIYSAGSASNNTALALHDQLAEIGMQVEPEGLGFEVGSERLDAGDAYLSSHGPAYDLDLDFYPPSATGPAWFPSFGNAARPRSPKGSCNAPAWPAR